MVLVSKTPQGIILEILLRVHSDFFSEISTDILSEILSKILSQILAVVSSGNLRVIPPKIHACVS